MKRILPALLLICCSALAFSQTKNPKDDGRKIRVPVVFHVVKSIFNPISDTDILKSLEILNSDYSAMNDMSVLDTDFKHLVGNPNIEFYLYDKMLEKEGIKGVTRITSKLSVKLVDPENCINIVVADHGNKTIKDRIRLNFEEIGATDRAMTHETGHWLGLNHIWGEQGNCDVDEKEPHDDKVSDTPEQGKCTCIDDYKPICPPPYELTYKGHKTLYNNFMDYNGCRCMFTIKQCIVMRNTLIEETNLFK